MSKKNILVLVVAFVVVLSFIIWGHYQQNPSEFSNINPTSPFHVSLYDISRVTKKTFAMYITPATSPVQPEKFIGYHTGADFETTPAEADIDVPVSAFCDGKLLIKRHATGYGGVAVESCVLKGQAVTVIYGHLKLASITLGVGQALKKGDPIGVLGKGYSTETDGERKHLHLGIHIGPAINILGYVQNKADLSGWLDPVQFLSK